MSVHHLRLESDRRQVMLALALTILPILWFVRTDFALYAGDWEHLRPRFAIRGLALVGVVGSVWLLSRYRSAQAYSNIVLGTAIGVACYLLALNATRPPGATLSVRTPLFNLFLLYAALPNTLWRQCLPPIALSAGLILLRLTYLTSDASNDAPGDIAIIVICNILGILMLRHRVQLERQLAASWQAEAAERDARQRAVDELRALRQVIPICAHCKSVRSEVGEWHRIEAYVKAHIEADFSHGVCPSCLAEHYSDIVTPSEAAAARGNKLANLQ